MSEELTDAELLEYDSKIYAYVTACIAVLELGRENGSIGHIAALLAAGEIISCAKMEQIFLHQKMCIARIMEEAPTVNRGNDG